MLPFALFWLIEDLDETTARRLGLLLCLFLTANSVVGLIEGVSSWRLVTVDLPPDVSADPSRTDLIFDWRAALALDNRSTALLGHPLSNAMTTSAFVVALAEGGARWLPAIIRFPAMGLAVISLATFGGRAGMALTYIFLAWKAATILFDVAIGRRRFSASQAAIGGAAAIGMALALAGAYGAGVFDTVIQRFSEDAGSANARLVMFDLFKVFSWEELLLRPDPELLATIQRVEGLEFGIESFWIVFALQFGLIVAGVLLTGIAAYCLALYRAAGVGAGAVLAIFFVIASTSTSISGKSTGLGLLAAVILLILRRDTRPLSLEEIAPEGLSQPFLHKYSTSGGVGRRVS